MTHSLNTRLHTLICAVIFILLITLNTNVYATDTQTHQLGITQLKTDHAGVELTVRVFYPTLEQAARERFGPWELDAAKHAKPAPGPFPLVIVSHGLSGTDWNHHLLARALVQQGIVVAALKHPDDLLRVGTPEHLKLRPAELSKALDSVLDAPRFRDVIDASRIGAFGFSLGGYTVLAALGGQIDHNRIAEHCQTPDVDPEYCTGEPGGEPLPLVLRLRRLVYNLPDTDLNADVRDTRLKAAVLAAPLGQLFKDLTDVTMPLMLLGAGNDQSLRAPYHADWIHGLLPEGHSFKSIPDLHHYAFLSPFPDSIASQVGEPATDPPGFNRDEFLKAINLEIADFFAQVLSP